MYRQIQGSVSPLQFLGAPVSVRLTNGQVVRGEVFCYDVDGSNTVVLKEQKEADRAAFRLIKIQHVREISAHGPPPLEVDSWLPSCNPKILDERERAARASFESMRHTIGIGVTQEAQEIFNFIHKTHPDCRWTRDRRISVMGVTVKPAYSSEDCEGSGRALDRIKQVIKKYRQRRETDKSRMSPTMAHAYNGQILAGMSAAATGQPSLAPPQFSSLQAPGTYPDPGLAYMAGPGGSIMSVGPNGITTADGNGIMMLQPTPTPPGGGGMFMMVVHGGDERGGQQMLPIPGHSGPFFAPVLLAGPHGARVAAVSGSLGPNTPQGSFLVPAALPPPGQVYDMSSRPVMNPEGAVLCQLNSPMCQEDPSSLQMRSNDASRADASRPFSAPPPPGQPHGSPTAFGEPSSPQPTMSNPQPLAGGQPRVASLQAAGQWSGSALQVSGGMQGNRVGRTGPPGTPNAPQPSDSGGASDPGPLASTPKTATTPGPLLPLDSSGGGAWTHSGQQPQRNQPAGKSNRNHQRRGGRRREG